MPREGGASLRSFQSGVQGRFSITPDTEPDANREQFALPSGSAHQTRG